VSSLAAEVMPIKAKSRIQALDVIRGVSILGVLAVNADGFAAPISASLKPDHWPFPNEGATAISYWIMDAFFHEKFVTLFSMLFGISLFLVGGERADKGKSRILWRRLSALFLFAMLHGFGIWWGDILSMYAVTGIIMQFCRSWQPKALMLTGILLFGAMACRELPSTVYSAVSPALRSQAAVPNVPDPTATAAHKARIAADFAQAKDSWAGAYQVNTRSYMHQLANGWSGIPATLGLMMIGLSLFKSGFFAARSSRSRYVTVMGIGAFALAIVCWITWRADVVGSAVLGGSFLITVLAPPVALAYAATLILVLRSGFAAWLSPFAATGKIAFTNYLTQSIIMTSIFYGGRGALIGEVDRPALWGIVIGVWALQLIWSPLWLTRFEMGPLEWVWRCLTYGHRVPLVKQK
jgi:uncharacterized protein